MCCSEPGGFIFYVTFLNLFNLIAAQTSIQGACYYQNGIAKTCMTYPKNVAFNQNVTATNTCGAPSELYCQIGADTDKCQTCDSSNPARSHPPKNMVDLHNPTNITWWQSQSWWQTNKDGSSKLFQPIKVNVTVSFNKLYLITGSIRVTFRTVRPKRMLISRSSDYGKTWKIYQYFAKNCLSAYSLAADPVISLSNRFQATCSQKFSSELPNEGGPVVFDPRVTRYIVSEYLNVDVQHYLAATDVRFSLEYPGTDGREYINSTDTLSQYYYAISDIIIDGRCDCNGHAEYCDKKNGTEICDCKHFTTGQDCQVCLPRYNNRPWMAGNATNANECQKCTCYDHSSSCLYDSRIRAGICQNCQHNTRGSNCDTCVQKYYRNISKPLNDANVCQPCDCFILGVTDNGTCLQAASSSRQLGQCNCKAGVFGRKCDQCLPGKWGFVRPPIGTCFDCACNEFGTIGNNGTCDQYTGQCNCKTNIESRTCSQCKERFHGFPANSTADCTACSCDVAGGYPVCNKLTGVCTCRRGIVGNKCSSVNSGYFFPNFSHVKYEVETQPIGNHEYYWLLKGYNSIFLGYGQIKLSEGQSVSYTFQVAVTHGYFMAFRYSLYPITWYNTVFLYNAESLIWSGSQMISSYILSTDNPAQWNLSLSIYDSSNALVKTTPFTLGSLLVGEGGIWNDTSVIQLLAGKTYKIRVSYLSSGGSAGIKWPLLIDSVILMPDLSEISYFNLQSSARKSEIQQCYMQSRQLQTMPSMSNLCRQHTFSISVLMYNGTLPCDCYIPGSINSSICEQYGGKCTCKPGYGGRRCDLCLPGFFGDSKIACTACGCSAAGSLTPVCNQTTGSCFCKLNTQGSKCESCKINTFALTASNPDGCRSCYGFGHLISCKPATQFVQKEIISNFTSNGLDGWSLINMNGSSVVTWQLKSSSSGLQYLDEGGIIRYLNAPSKFLGNQLRSYGQLLIMEMSISPYFVTVVSRSWHVRLTGGGMTAVFRLYPSPNRTKTIYTVRLHEKFMANQTKLSEFDFKSLLGQLTGLHIIVNYYVSPTSITFKYIKIESASILTSAGLQLVGYIENATCQLGYEGLSCERCIKGYTRTVPNGGPLVRCIPCSCNQRSTECDQQSGICRNCRTGTTGDHCEKCMPNLMSPNCSSCLAGYWKISASGCKPCNCFLPGTINGTTIKCDLVTGQCACNSSMNVQGRQCNQCKQNAYNVSLGELRCKQCPPCYSLIEQDYILLHYQMSLLQNEVDTLLKDPSLLAIAPLHQSLATVSRIVNNLTSRAQASLSSATAITALWNILQRNITTLQSTMISTTTLSFNNAISDTSQVLSFYNQSYASLVSISTKVVSSNNLLSASLTGSITQQQAAVKQLRVLLNETTVQLALVQSKLASANVLKSTAITRVSQSILASSLAANNSLLYQNSVSIISSSMRALRTSVSDAESQGLQMQQFASAMKSNASSTASYATQLNSNITATLTDYAQTISAINAATTALTAQRTNLNARITSATSNNNAVGQEISVLKQTNAVLSSQVSTTDRRLTAVNARVAAAATKSTNALTSASNTEKEALSILNTVKNFQTVSQQASIDAANALKKIGEVKVLTTASINTTTKVNNEVSPIKSKVNQAVTLSTQSSQIATTEKQEMETIHKKATSLQNQSQSALNTISGLQVQQYVVSSVNPLLSRCVNYTADAKNVQQKAQSAKSQATQSMVTAQTLATAATQLSSTFAVIPTIRIGQLSTIYDNILRVRTAYTTLSIVNDLAGLKIDIAANRLKIIEYRLKVNFFKTQIAAHTAMYNSLSTLTCNVPSQVP